MAEPRLWRWLVSLFLYTEILGPIFVAVLAARPRRPKEDNAGAFQPV